MSAKGVRSSCRGVAHKLSLSGKAFIQAGVVSLNEALHWLSSVGTSSVILISARLSGRGFDLRCKHAQWPKRAARTKYAITPPKSVTTAVMYQLVVPKDSCASLWRS